MAWRYSSTTPQSTSERDVPDGVVELKRATTARFESVRATVVSSRSALTTVADEPGFGAVAFSHGSSDGHPQSRPRQRVAAGQDVPRGPRRQGGHDLIIDVTRWDATVEVADEPAGWTIELNADPRSLEIREGLRGVKPLTDKDRVEIRKNIDEKILGSHPIQFRSSGVRPADDGRRLTVEGELSMAGNTRPLTAQLSVEDGGAISATIP